MGGHKDPLAQHDHYSVWGLCAILSRSHLGSEDTAWLQCNLFLDFSIVTEQRLMDPRSSSYLDTPPQVGLVQHHVITWLRTGSTPGHSGFQTRAIPGGQG